MEKKLLETNSNFNPKLFLRYVNDVFAVFNDNNSCLKFLNVLNSQNKNIKFTVEHASDTISILDVEIKLTELGVDTWVSRKQTHTNLLLNFK